MATYSEVMRVLAALYGADEKALHGPLRGRVQNLQKLGIPAGLKVGKGKRIDYKPEQIYEIVFCMELAETGIIPSVMKSITLQASYLISRIFKKERQHPSTDNDTLLVLQTKQMSSYWANDEVYERCSVYKAES